MKIKKIWMPFLLLVGMLSSCEKFLDVSAGNQILQEDFFGDGDGFHVAVNGVYRRLSENSLYGRNLSWGFISGLGSNYQINTALPSDVRFGANFEWDNSNVLSATEQIWSRGYNLIANANNIIQQAETRDSAFFQYGNMEKNLILGEMYGIRAMMHFELLRLFSPAPVTGFTGTAIPYVTAYPDRQPQPKSQDEVFSHIVADMEKAKTLLGPLDTAYIVRPGTTTPIIRSIEGRIRYTARYDIEQGDFFNYRAQRMNFFAATGLLARIYLYRQDYDKAYENAKIVYDYQIGGWFTWTAASNQGSSTNIDNINTKRPLELLLAFANNRNYDNFDAVSSNVNAFRMNAMDLLFANDLNDYRYVGWYNRYGDLRYLTWTRPLGTSANALNVAQYQGPLLPLMRFSEMYHIIIECLARQERVPEAVDILNDLRTRRGALRRIETTLTSAELMDVLVNDIIRETLTEGQTFFMFKRLNRNIYRGATDRVMAPADWVAPIPLSETNYQF